MLTNNHERLNIWLGLKNRFNYQEFFTACTAQNVPALDAYEFAQKAGLISVAIESFPDLPPAEAYRLFVQQASAFLTSSGVRPSVTSAQSPTQPQLVPTITSSCGSCGGGRVR